MSWYCHQDLKPQGPFDLRQIRTKILRGEVGPQDFLLNEQVGDWRPAIQWGIFEYSLFPALQNSEVRGHGLTDWKSAEWVLLREVQEGPYSLLQLEDMFKRNQITTEMYIWKAGLSGWVQIKDRPEFTSLAQALSAVKSELQT